MPSEYQLNQGKAIDVLQHDYPRLFEDEPDFSIFADTIELYDPTGKRVEGLAQYRRIFDMFRFLRATAMSKAEVSYRLVVNGDTIRLRWSSKLWMRGELALVHLDGVSAYELDATGMIRRHRLENIVLTGRDATQTQLAYAWPHAELAHLGVPSAARPFFRSIEKALADPSGTIRLESSVLPLAAPLPHIMSALPAARQTPALAILASRRAPPPQAAAGETPFERAQRERAEDAAKEASRRAMARDLFADEDKDGPLSFLRTLSKPQACESDYDCERPLVCCDLLLASVCCSSGMMVGRPQPTLQGQLIPIPVERDDDIPGMPPGVPRPPPTSGGWADLPGLR